MYRVYCISPNGVRAEKNRKKEFKEFYELFQKYVRNFYKDLKYFLNFEYMRITLRNVLLIILYNY